jgi:predicted NAD/FAD-binding protein
MAPHRIAIIGSGIAGLSAAWLLSRSQDVTLIEKATRLGGHANTFVADAPEGPVAVDTGFIVFNEQNYPNFTALLAHLGVESAESSMGFAVSTCGGRMEYSGRHLNGLFGQRRNIVRPKHWQLVSDILRFFRLAEQQAEGLDDSTTIGEFLERFGYSKVFIEDHMLPISAAIWSTPARGMLDYPARAFITFFANHGLLQVGNRPKWRTVVGGSGRYVDRLLEESRVKVLKGAHLAAVERHANGVELVFETGERRAFEQVVFACHADEALRLLADPTPEEANLLSAFRFTPNRAVLHSDARFMPRRKHLWSAWNYLRSSDAADANLSLTYWMNRLQPLATSTDLFVTLNPMGEFAPGTVQATFDYEHPLYDARMVAAQREIWQIQGNRGSWYAGAWLGHGFHEDALQSGLEIAERIGPVNRPWLVKDARGRVAHNWAGGEQVKWAAE